MKTSVLTALWMWSIPVHNCVTVGEKAELLFLIVNITETWGIWKYLPRIESNEKVMQTTPLCWEISEDSIYAVFLNLQRLFYEQPENKNNWHPGENIRSKEEIPIKRKKKEARKKRERKGGREEIKGGRDGGRSKKEDAVKRWYWRLIKVTSW